MTIDCSNVFTIKLKHPSIPNWKNHCYYNHRHHTSQDSSKIDCVCLRQLQLMHGELHGGMPTPCQPLPFMNYNCCILHKKLGQFYAVGTRAGLRSLSSIVEGVACILSLHPSCGELLHERHCRKTAQRQFHRHPFSQHSLKYIWTTLQKRESTHQIERSKLVMSSSSARCFWRALSDKFWDGFLRVAAALQKSIESNAKVRMELFLMLARVILALWKNIWG